MFTQVALRDCSFLFGLVNLLNAVFWLTVISQVTIFNYAKFPQYIQGDNGPLTMTS